MRIVHENGQTDLTAGILTMEDNHGKRKHYVRRDTEGTLPTTPDLVAEPGGLPEFAPQHMLDGNDLVDMILVGIKAQGKGPVAYTAAHEYKANDRAFAIWCQFCARGNTTTNIDAKAVKQRLDAANPGGDWTVEEIEREWQRWIRDKT